MLERGQSEEVIMSIPGGQTVVEPVDDVRIIPQEGAVPAPFSAKSAACQAALG